METENKADGFEIAALMNGRHIPATQLCEFDPAVMLTDAFLDDVFSKEFQELVKGIRERARRKEYTPRRILRSGDRTIVFWEDGEKTIVKMGEDTVDSPYDAFTAALAIKIMGSNSALKRMIAKKLEYR